MRTNHWLVLLVCFVGVWPSTLVGQESIERQKDFLRSVELFNSARTPEEFRESAYVLESMVDDGFRNGAVYYNLGNAYYRAGEFGRAILNYRKAKPFRPRDPLLEANLQQARLASPGKLAQPPKPWWLHVLFWTESLAYPTRAALALILFSMAPIAAFISIMAHRRSLSFVAAGLVAIAALFAMDCFINSPERSSSLQAVITGETIARKGIGKDYEAAFDAPLKDGAEFTVLDETSGWTFGHFAGIGDGWVKNEFVAR
jgi:tetratricopeptide (TPR) repeat protein